MAIDKKTGKTYASSMKASAEWAKEHIKHIKVAFNIDTDSEVIDKIMSVPNKTDYIRQLVLDDLAKEKK